MLLTEESLVRVHRPSCQGKGVYGYNQAPYLQLVERYRLSSEHHDGDEMLFSLTTSTQITKVILSLNPAVREAPRNRTMYMAWMANVLLARPK